MSSWVNDTSVLTANDIHNGSHDLQCRAFFRLCGRSLDPSWRSMVVISILQSGEVYLHRSFGLHSYLGYL